MEDATPKLPSVGDVVGGKYRVDRVIGRGGMGTVVAVRHLGLDEARALKLMLPRGLELPQARERFFREARAAAKLRSEHAVAVHDVGVLPDGFPYIEMELLEGTDLSNLLKRSGAAAIVSAVDWIAQACDAVGEAHALGIVHRDLKPGNLFLCRTQSGRELIKVLDFGIAKTVSADADMTLTGTHASFGSPMYMSPEQMRGARYADPRSDIWGLGVVLFELLTGKRPFAAESVTALALVVTNDPAPHPRTLRADIPAEVDAIVMRCLEKDPAARFGSATELAAALRASIGIATPPMRASLASLPAHPRPHAPSFAGGPVPAAPPSQPSHPHVLPQASPAPPLGPPPGSTAARPPQASHPLVAASFAIAAAAPAAPPPSQPSLGLSLQQQGAPMTSSRPSVATLPNTDPSPGRPRPAFLITAIGLACVLGLMIAMLTFRATSAGPTASASSPSSPAASAASAAPPTPSIEPTPPAAAPEPAPAPSAADAVEAPPTPSVAAVGTTARPVDPVASAKPAPSAGPPRSGKLIPKPKTGFGGID